MKLKYEEVSVDFSYLRISLVSILISTLGFDIYKNKIGGSLGVNLNSI
jgi:hypothetical protein